MLIKKGPGISLLMSMQGILKS